MGLFGNKKSEEEIMEEALEESNIFEGINCSVIFPHTQLKIASHNGVTRGVATLTFGIVGLAATSGIKHNEEKRKLITDVQVVEKGIVFKKATKDNKDFRLPYESIIRAERRDHNSKSAVFIVLLENQDIQVNIIDNPVKIIYNEYVATHLIDTINERARGAQYEEAGWGLEHATAEPQEVKEESDSLMDELERLGNIYEKGLLTDEEFATMKKKLIEQ